MRSDFTVPFRPRQPEPLSTQVVHLQGMTVISRLYPVEQVAQCGNCAAGECTADNTGMCVIVVPRHIPDSQAASFRFAGPATGRGLGGATG
jgi:hypothetical protein